MKYATAMIAALWIGSVFAQEGAIQDESPAVDQADEKADPDAATTKAAKPEEFKPPPGFVTKKRGKFVLYCKKDSTIGTRFKTERCYDENQIRDYLVALEEQKRDIDRIRATCATKAVCAPE